MQKYGQNGICRSPAIILFYFAWLVPFKSKAVPFHRNGRFS